MRQVDETAAEGVASVGDIIALRRSGYRRPAAPRFELRARAERPGAAEPAREAGADETVAVAPVVCCAIADAGKEANATTLISRRSEMLALAPPASTQRGGTQRGGTQRGGTQRGGTQRGGTQRGGSQRGGSKVRVEEAADEEPAPDWGLDGEFFRGGFDSYPPIVSEVAPDTPPVVAAPSAAQLRRRTTLRRAVAAMVAAVALVAIGLGVKARLLGNAIRAERHQAAAAAVIGREAPRSIAQLRRLEKARDARLAAKEAQRTEDAQAEPEGWDTLADATVELLEAHKLEPARAHARRLVAERPDHAFGYRCLGAALQDMGRRADALATYGACVHQAKHGDVQECAALGGH